MIVPGYTGHTGTTHIAGGAPTPDPPTHSAFHSTTARGMERTAGMPTRDSARIYTISMWVKRNNADLGQFFSVAGDFWAGWMPGGNPTIKSTVAGATFEIQKTALGGGIDSWHHYFWHVDGPGGFITFWIDGAQDGSPSAVTIGADLPFGANAVNHRHNGQQGAYGNGVRGWQYDPHIIDGLLVPVTEFGSGTPGQGTWLPIGYGGSHGSAGVNFRYDDDGNGGDNMGLDSANGHDYLPYNPITRSTDTPLNPA